MRIADGLFTFCALAAFCAVMVALIVGAATRTYPDCAPGFAYAELADGSHLCVILPSPTAGGR